MNKRICWGGENMKTPEDLVNEIKLNGNLLMTNFRNDEGSASSLFRINLLQKTKVLIEEAIKDGIEDPEVFRTAKILGYEKMVF